MHRIEVIVALDYETDAERAAALDAVERAGLAIDADSRESTLGFLSGTIESSALARLRAVRGVLSVEKSRSFPPIPPDSEVQ